MRKKPALLFSLISKASKSQARVELLYAVGQVLIHSYVANHIYVLSHTSDKPNLSYKPHLSFKSRLCYKQRSTRSLSLYLQLYQQILSTPSLSISCGNFACSNPRRERRYRSRGLNWGWRVRKRLFYRRPLYIVQALALCRICTELR